MDVDLARSIAELRAILEGIRMAMAMNYERTLVETDCLLAINLILKKTEYWGEVEVVVADIWAFIPFFTEIEFLFVPRKCNLVDDGLAKRARMSKISGTWVCFYPSWIISLVNANLSHIAHEA